MEIIKKPLYIGAAAAALSFLLGGSESVPVFGMALPEPILNGLTLTASSLVTESIKGFVLEKIQSGSMASIEAAAVEPVLNSLAAYGVVLLGGGNPSLVAAATLGVGSTLAGNYAFDALQGRF